MSGQAAVAERPKAGSEEGLRARLFDSDRTDKLLGFDEALKARVSSRQLLWIDVEGDLDEEHRRALAERFELEPDTVRALADSENQPHVELHGEHFHLRVAAEPNADRPEVGDWLEIVAGPNVVISRHAGRLHFLEAINERIAADATIGELDSAEFVASVLDAVVTTYYAAADRIEDELDAHDAKALQEPRLKDGIDRLIAMRRRVGQLRRLLAAHRELFGSLGRRDFGRGISSADPKVFLPVAGRFEGALASVESTRELVLSSFDVLMTRTAQRTNDVMRVLTLATVLALPATITAGFLGMNLIVPLPKDDPNAFWVVMGAVLAFEAIMLGLARWRGWI
jgi:magnesium transporter